jgi:serine/threonine-protein kinase RIM15
MSQESIDFIKKLLTIDAKKRLGAQGAEEVKAHPWFAGIDWESFRNQPAFFVPNTEGMDDTSYFDGILILPYFWFD